MTAGGYTELHCHSGFSFLDGASQPEELAAAAAAQGHEALAITDHDGVWGAMEFAQAARPLGVRPIVGAEVTVRKADRRFHLTLLVESVAGWHGLCRLLTEAHAGTRPVPGREPLPPVLDLESIEREAEGLVCLSGCAREGALAGVYERAGARPSGSEARYAEALGRRLHAAFGPERFRIELQRPLRRHDMGRNRWLSGLADRLGVQCVATGNVHAHDRARTPLQDALVAVRLGGTLDETEALRRGNRQAVLRAPAEMAALFAEHPDAVAETARLADRLTFDLTRDHGYRYPGAEDTDADRKLAELCAARFDDRYARTPQRDEAIRRLEEELRVIRKLELSGFFLLHADLLELAREVAVEVRGPESARSVLPPGRGRGSSVSSVVCYLTGLSHVDPVKSGLFLGRFLNEEITEAPDIDLDFPRDVREKLIPRIHERYGHERSALVAAFPTFRVRGAVRDLGKALGLPPTEIERVARAVDGWAGEGFDADVALAIGERRARAPRWRALSQLVRDAFGLPRHPSQHPGGMVLSTRPLTELCPVVPAAMEGRQIVQWDKDSCADAGFLKIDLLGLGMLSAVERCVDAVARTRGERLDLSRIPLDDEEVFSAIRRAETTGVFQIESRAQMQMLPRSLPRNLDDLTVQVALVRPGPIQGGAVHPYIERRERRRVDPDYEIPYAHPSLAPVLEETLGVIVFQDQVLEVSIALAGFSPGEAEGLRRAMSRKRSDAAILVYRERFIDGAVERGVERAVAERVFEQVRGFSGFGFPKAHAAAFGLLAYQSTWLRVHYAPEFLCALLNEQPMGFYPPDALVHDAQRRGIEVLPPHINCSTTECRVEAQIGRERGWGLTGKAIPAAAGDGPTPEGPARHGARDLAVRIGLGYVQGVKEEEVKALVAERDLHGSYTDAGDLAARSGAGRDTLERLAWSGACDDLPRREALWQMGVVTPGRAVPGGVQLSLPLSPPEAPALKALTAWERLLADYGSFKISIAEHPMALLRPDLPESVLESRALEQTPDRSRVSVAGLVVARQRPATAKGVTFMLLEDEWGTINLIVPPPVYQRHRLAVRSEPFVLARGRLESRLGTTNVVVEELTPIERPDLPRAAVKHIEPPAGRETGRPDEHALPAAAAGDLRAVLPSPHSFGRRGR